MPDEQSRLASLSVVGGALEGQRHDVVDVVGEVLIGSDPSCQLCLDLPSVSPIHARVWTELGGATVRDTSAPRGVYVNSVRVETEAAFGPGDSLWLGPPNEPDSVCIQGTFEPWQEVLPRAAATPAAPAPAAAAAASAAASPSGPSDEDPFFIAAEASPPKPSTAPAPVPVAAPAPTPVPAPAPRRTAAPSPTLAPTPTPAEPVIMGEVADDWVISESPVPASEPSEPAASALPTFSAVPEAAPGDDFFVADAIEVAADEAAPPAPVPPPAQPPTAPAAAKATAATAARAPAATAARPPASPAGTPHATAPQAAPAARPASPPAAAARPAGVPATKAPASPQTPGAAKAPAPAAQAPGAVAKAPAAPVSARPTTPRPAGSASSSASRPPQPPATPTARTTARPTPRPTPSVRPAAGRSAPRPAGRRSAGGRSLLKTAAPVIAALAILGGLAAWRVLGTVRVDGIEPNRVRVGQRAVIRGRGFSADPAANAVLFDDKSAKVLAAASDRLEVEVPEAVSEAGSERSVSVRVRRGSRSSGPLVVSVIQGPRLHALSPEAALPGEEVVVAGAGLGLGANVRFGATPAQVVQAEPTRVRVVVPELAIGTSAPVVVSVGGSDSNPAPFVVGRLPLVTGITPRNAAPGDVVRVSGLGFNQSDAAQNEVQIGGIPALVVSVADATLEVVVPRVGPGESARTLSVRASGGASLGTGTLDVPPPADAVEPRFVAEPFTAVAGRAHAVVATGLGPAFVLAASGGRTAAQRAVEAAGRLNQAIPVLQSTLGLSCEARGFGSNPVIGLAGRPDVLLEVSAEDAAAYGEDWTGLRGRGGPISRDRLARWWEALARDLVLLLVRGERPHFAADLAVEGRVLPQLFDAARKTGQPGVPRSVLDQGRPPLRDGLRLVGLRVPATVAAPAPPAGQSPVATPTPGPARIAPIEGMLRGSELEAGEQRYLTVTFEKTSGSISFEGGITLTMPFLLLERVRDQVHFTVNIRGGVRHYVGKWDGQKLVGSISTDAAGKEVVGTFELHR